MESCNPADLTVSTPEDCETASFELSDNYLGVVDFGDPFTVPSGCIAFASGNDIVFNSHPIGFGDDEYVSFCANSLPIVYTNGYEFGEPNTLDCDKPALMIITEEECREAAEMLGGTFTRIGYWRGPFGCIADEDEEKF